LSRKIEQERVAVVNFRVNERRSNRHRALVDPKISNTPQITNIEEEGNWNEMRCVEKKKDFYPG
jgi:hypothetical protein